MWIKSLEANQETFKRVDFKPGFNVVVANRTSESGSKDTRNGLGKTTLLHIIHYCFGSELRGSPLDKEALKEWIFTLTLNLKGKEYKISRWVLDGSVVYIEADNFDDLPVKPEYDMDEKKFKYTNTTWKIVLGELLFGINEEIRKEKFKPSFRAMFSYSARNDPSAFLDPFKYFQNQKAWTVQVYNSYLLGLDYQFASKFQILKDKEKEAEALLKVLGGSELLEDVVGSLGELESVRVNMNADVQELDAQLKSFEVHPQYNDIQEEANDLTKKKNELLNERFQKINLVDRYTSSLKEEVTEITDLSSIYEEVGLHFSDSLKVRLDELVDFHDKVISNRKNYLEKEIITLNSDIPKIDAKIEKLSKSRAELMSILETHKALDEYSLLHERLVEKRGELDQIQRKIQTLKKVDSIKTDLIIERAELVKSASEDKTERINHIDSIVKEFSDNSKYLYAEPGNLSVDITDNGYKFKVSIERAESQGVRSMKVFCYDLLLAKIKEELFKISAPLVHDSTLFDGVDERQIARALELAYQKSEMFGFQYICLMNSDLVPDADFTEGFKEKFASSIRLELTDSGIEGSLMGVKF